MKGERSWRVDDGAHLLYFGARGFPCDREIAAALPWRGHALLLSADTDCLSLWDADGLIRTARVGVYPQGMALQGEDVLVCGGADGKVHRLSLPALRETAEYALPGMPERACMHSGAACVLSLLPEEPVCTALLRLDLSTGENVEISRFPGIPGAIAADGGGLWVGVSERVMHLPWGTDAADRVMEGLGLPSKIEVTETGVIITDALEGRRFFVRR